MVGSVECMEKYMVFQQPSNAETTPCQCIFWNPEIFSDPECILGNLRCSFGSTCMRKQIIQVKESFDCDIQLLESYPSVGPQRV